MMMMIISIPWTLCRSDSGRNVFRELVGPNMKEDRVQLLLMTPQI